MILSLEEKINKALELVKEKYKDSSHNDRYLHILGVANMAKKLALKYGVDPNEAYLAGLMHDYYKFESYEEMGELLTAEERLEAEACPVLYHNYASARAYQNIFGNDIEIVNAIRCHTFGHTKMTKLEEILLISDYTEENRKYENCIYCRNLLERGLFNTAIYESTKFVISFLAKKCIKAHTMQYAVLEEYKEKIKMDLLEIVTEALDKVKASEIKVYDTKYTSPFYDNIVLATVASSRQCEAVKGYLEEFMKDTPFSIRGVEGKGTGWVLFDLNDIILSVFTPEERERVNLEELYKEIEG